MPVVLDVPEILALIDKLSPGPRLMAEVQYGAGLRVSEVVSLRIKDVDIARGMVTIRCGKGDVDRVTVLPNVLKERLVLGITGPQRCADDGNLHACGHGQQWLRGA